MPHVVQARCADCGRTIYGPVLGNKVAMPPYCNDCWSTWNKANHTRFLDEPLHAPAPYRGTTCRDFQGARVHVLQVGLGTYGTFIQPDTGWMLTLLEAPAARGSTAPP